MVWSDILALTVLVLSTVLGSVLAYAFALRTARRERLHEVKLGSYTRYLQSLTKMTKAADALLLVATPGKNSGDRFEALTRAARMVFPTAQFREVMGRSRALALSVTKSGKVKSDTQAFSMVNRPLEEEVVDQVTGTVVDQVLVLEDEETVLRMIGSEAINSQEAKTMRAMVALVLGALMTMHLEGAPTKIRDLAPGLLESLEESIKAMTQIIESEVKATL